MPNFYSNVQIFIVVKGKYLKIVIKPSHTDTDLKMGSLLTLNTVTASGHLQSGHDVRRKNQLWDLLELNLLSFAFTLVYLLCDY